MRVATVVLSWNSRQLIDNCLQGLIEHEKCHIYVVDNGSADGSPDYIRSRYPGVEVICLPRNLGFAAGNNVGIERALSDGFEAVCLLNNDTIIDENFLPGCVDLLEKNQEIGIVGPVIVEGNEPNTIQSRGCKISFLTLKFPKIDRGKLFIREESFRRIDFVHGAAMVVRREVLVKTGGFDEEFYPAYVEEADLCYRAKLMGYYSAVYNGSRVRHLGGKSSSGRENEFRRMMKNRFLFGLKHLGFLKFFIGSQFIVFRVIIDKLFGSY